MKNEEADDKLSPCSRFRFIMIPNLRDEQAIHLYHYELFAYAFRFSQCMSGLTSTALPFDLDAQNDWSVSSN